MFCYLDYYTHKINVFSKMSDLRSWLRMKRFSPSKPFAKAKMEREKYIDGEKEVETKRIYK